MDNNVALRSLQAIISFFMIIFIFELYQRRDYVYQGAPDQARWRDLRIWAGLILIAQSALYLIF